MRRAHPVRRLLTIILLLGILAIPALAALSAYQDYVQLRTLGQDAVHHLLAAKDALIPSKSSGSSSSCSSTGVTATPSSTASGTGTPTPTGTPSPSGSSTTSGLSGLSIPDAAHLATAEHELRVAQAEFRELEVLLERPNPTLALAGNLPAISSKVTTARELVYVGDDASTVGLNLVAAAAPLLERLKGGALSSTTQPLITRDEATQLRGALVNSMSLLDDIGNRVSNLDPSELPISACQRAEYVSLTSKIPQVRNVLAQAPALFDSAMWLLGVDGQRQFLVQTLDSSELRPTGGFTGDYGILDIQGGRVQPFTLRDVDGVYLNTPFSYRPPNVYDWWPFQRWGLRDSNLSPDFPTTAKLNIALFEGPQHIWKTIGLSDHNLDGVIELTPVPIAHILLVTGPITVPTYGDVVTADNLVTKIHYYQQDPTAIARQAQLSPDVPTTVRKRWTYIVSHMLEERVRHMSVSQLMSLAQIMLTDMRAHEIQVYFTDPEVENLLLAHSYGSHLTTTTGQDSLMIDQANVSVSKASPYIQTTVQDNVALDTKGGAAHRLTITLKNIPKGPYYGFTTYRDYVRVYVPQGAHLQFANGFDTGVPVCWAPPPWHPNETVPDRFKSLSTCPGSGLFPDGSLQCPAGGYGPGPRSYDTFGGDSKTDFPVDDTGDPTNTTSDLAGRAMYGGFVTIPVNCTSVITLNYYVPNVAAPSSAVPASAAAYSYVIERQAGTNITYNIHIQPSKSVAAETQSPVSFKSVLTTDATILVPRRSS